MVLMKARSIKEKRLPLEPDFRTPEQHAFMRAVVTGLDDLRLGRTVPLRTARERLGLQDPAGR